MCIGDIQTGQYTNATLLADQSNIIPLPSSGSRRKPFLGSSTVTRTDAFYWFRLMHERLLNSQEEKAKTTTTTTADQPLKTKLKEKQSKKSKKTAKKTTKKTDQIQLLNVNLCNVPILHLVPSVYELESICENSMYIEVHFQDELPVHQYRMYCNAVAVTYTDNGCGSIMRHISNKTIILPVNVQEGQYGTFNAERLTAGDYLINDHVFKILPAVRTGKKRSRKKSRKNTVKFVSNNSIDNVKNERMKPSSINPLDGELGIWEKMFEEAMDSDNQKNSGGGGGSGWGGGTEGGREGGSSTDITDNIVSFEPPVILAGDNEMVCLTFVSDQDIPDTIMLFNTLIELESRTKISNKRWFNCKSLPVGEFKNGRCEFISFKASSVLDSLSYCKR